MFLILCNTYFEKFIYNTKIYKKLELWLYTSVSNHCFFMLRGTRLKIKFF